MTMKLPPDVVNAAALNGSSINLLLGEPLIFVPNGTGYAIGLWLKLDGIGGTAQILTDGLFPITVQGASISVSNGLTTVTSGNVLSANTWSWILFKYTNHNMVLEVDNIKCGSTYAIWPNNSNRLIGGITCGPMAGAQIRTVMVASFGLSQDPDLSGAAWIMPSDSSLLYGYFDFSKPKPADTSGRNGSINFTGTAQEVSTTPGLDLSYGGYAEPIGDATVTIQSNFTIQAWVYPETPAENSTIISSGRAGASPNFLRMQTNAQVVPGTNALYFNIGFRQQLGGGAPVVVSSGFVMPAYTWSNVAVVGSGTQIDLYVNGAWRGSGTLSQDAVSTLPLLIGATIGATPGEWTNSFRGMIQSIAVWKKALTAAEVVKYMNGDAAADNDCLGYYHFSTAPAANDVTLNPVALVGAAEIYERVIAIPSDPEFAREWSSVAEQFAERPEPAVPVEARNLVRPAPVKEEKARAAVEPLVREYSQILPQVYSSADRAKLIDDYRALVERAVAGRDQDGPVGVVRHAREGGRLVFYYRAPEGLYRVFDMDDTDDLCLTFKIEFGAGLIIGFIGLFGVPTSLTSIPKVKKVLEKAFKNKVVLTAITSALDGEITFRGVCLIFRAFYDQNLFGDLVKAAVTGLSYWDAFFAALTIVATALELIFPNPSSTVVLALFALKMATLLATLVIAWEGRPPGCLGQPTTAFAPAEDVRTDHGEGEATSPPSR
jgi:hypothetical protein